MMMAFGRNGGFRQQVTDDGVKLAVVTAAATDVTVVVVHKSCTL